MEKNILVSIYKNKVDIQNCANCRVIKVTSHTIKLWEKVVEHRLRLETNISGRQFGFILEISTKETIYLLRMMMEKYRSTRKNLHMIFIDLEKAYDQVIIDRIIL